MSASSIAQLPSRELTLFSEPDFHGKSITLAEPHKQLRVPWQVRSVRITEGDRWLLCSQADYEGDCKPVFESLPRVRLAVASALPRRHTNLPPPPPMPAGFGGPSLRGATSEFFPAPESNGARIVCGAEDSSCAEKNAERFCRMRGWSGAAYAQEEKSGSATYVADVLCTQGHD
ncbi:MAG: hypothetical protein ACM3YM_04490 [Sphingomonadales bacterium]